MKSRYYKIKNKEGEYWSGYSSHFTKSGAEYSTLEDAGSALEYQRSRFHHKSINGWITDAEVEEFVVEVRKSNSFNAINIAKLAVLSEQIYDAHGREFHKGFYKLLKEENKFEVKFAVRIQQDTYSELRSTLKDLGYSSRHYRKTGNWIWFSDEEIGMRIKLIDGELPFVKLEEYITRFNELNVTMPEELAQDDEPTQE